MEHTTTLTNEQIAGSTIVGANFRGDRKASDFYPTPVDATRALMEFLNLQPCKIWEPACGEGAMSKVLESYGHNVYSSDIRHTGFGQGGIDFLIARPPLPFDAIITNPPFNLSHLFIKKALICAPFVAMILKSQYWHAKSRIELFESNPPAWVLPLTWRPDFLEHERLNGEKGSPTMDVLWSVWDERESQTKYKPLAKP